MLIRFSSGRHNEAGIGLIEVMVSLLILATAAMGFALMQSRSTQATQDALQRTYALTILDNLANQIRLAVTMFGENAPNSTTTDATVLGAYAALLKSGAAPSSIMKYCTPTIYSSTTRAVCGLTDWPKNDYAEAYMKANEFRISLGAVTCQGTTGRLCLLAAWNETRPVAENAPDACLSTTGNYQPGASCVMLEVYQ